MHNAALSDLLSTEAATRLLAFKRDVIQAMPGSVAAMILFGSRARGDWHSDSDYDVAVLLNGRSADDIDVRRRISDIVWDHQANGIHIQAVPMNAAALQPARTELALRIEAEGVPIQ